MHSARDMNMVVVKSLFLRSFLKSIPRLILLLYYCVVRYTAQSASSYLSVFFLLRGIL